MVLYHITCFAVLIVGHLAVSVKGWPDDERKTRDENRVTVGLGSKYMLLGRAERLAG
jgi:hypothetical protein